MTKYKTQLSFFLFLGCLSLVASACSNNSENKTDATNNSNNNQDKIVDSQIINQNLTIDGARCRGCGKCARLDSEHFTINQETRKAEVISQANLNSNKLSLAISMCHDRAIGL